MATEDQRRRHPDDEFIVARYRAGESIESIAARLKTSEDAVKARLKFAFNRLRCGLKHGRKPRVRKTDDALILAQIEAGKPVSEIAANMDVSQTSIYRRMVLLGISKR